MKQGKRIERYNTRWLESNKEVFNGEHSNVCSPLCFSIVFDSYYFIDIYNSLLRSHRPQGLCIPDESLLVSQFYKTFGTEKTNIQIYNVFETNGKFRIPTDIIKDVLSDIPEQDECFLYFVFILGKQGGFHKQAIIRKKDKFFVVDSNNEFVLEYTVEEFMAEYNFAIVSNLSVLINLRPDDEDVYQFPNGFLRFKSQFASHLI